jgi:hypothetical protein
MGHWRKQEPELLKVGDLVGHRFEEGLGVILKTPEQTNNSDYLVHFANHNQPAWYREKYLEAIGGTAE